jgi:probable F420-dependent oxidoreductase
MTTATVRSPQLPAWGMAITGVVRGSHAAKIAGFLADLEALGIGAVWFGESVGGESFATAGVLLARSERLVVAPGVANIAARSAAAMAAGRRILTEAYPKRFLLGLGSTHAAIIAGYGGRPIDSQLDHLTDYLDVMAATPGGIGDPAMPIVIAALGPRMLDLAAARGFGTHPWNVTLDRIAWMRERVGPDMLLAPRQAVLLCDDATVARSVARQHLATYLVFPNYRRNWHRQGFDDADLADGGSDALVDAMVAWGDEDAVLDHLDALRDAGTDHIAVHALSRPGMTPAAAALEVADLLHAAGRAADRRGA